ncbi:MMPL family transporter [Luteipulveratus flavus]|uniref:MMPL family transporter n=1 Tax=Luteipulveratus flavus TaxID=3031728 RepID=A0ABT6C3R9_9MICO|nr:MMPL family transporter [Luteipulveratus sp. YIM 133296]MDF8262719.1 MMPL family transporter [Luteipulveratus sp. YIM 133296]
MFAKLGKGVVRHPWWVIGAWVLLAAVVIATAPKLTTTNDESDFLPKHYESIKAAQLQEAKYSDTTTLGGIVVIDRQDGKALTAADNAKIKQIATDLGQQVKAPATGVAAGPPAADHRVQTLMVSFGKDADTWGDDAREVVKGMRENLGNQVKGTDLRYGITGPTAQAIDSEESDSKSEALIGIATIGLIIVLLLIIFRSPVIALLPIVLILLVSQVATGFIGWANEIFDLNADSSISVILIVVLFGIGTDYILFLMFRYRERLRMGEDKRTAMVSAVGRVGEAIASAAGAVIAAFMALVLSSLGIFRAIGPALAIAVAVMLVAGLTLVPAVVSLMGPKVFWPSKAWQREPKHTTSARIGRSLGRRPAVYAVVTGGVLVALSVFSFGFKPSFDFGSSGLPKDAESTVALNTLKQSLPAGSTDPSTVLVTSNDGGRLAQTGLTSYATGLSKVPGVGQVSPPELSKDGSTATYQVVLDDDPASEKAIDVVGGPLRDAAHRSPAGTTAYVGGSTSVYVDLDDAMVRDYKVVFPVAAVVIMLILGLLLRSIVAPLYLMASVGLGFGATLGATVLLMQSGSATGGLIFMLPIYMYLFVVALGTDYNILMVARLREEAREGRSPRDAAAKAFQHAGPTVAAAGLILAGSFASLMLAGNDLMVSMGFAISFGIGVAAFVMAMFFTPAITALLGHAAWWPGHGDARRRSTTPPPERDMELVGSRH